MPSAERLQESMSPAVAKLLPSLHIPDHPISPSPWQAEGRGPDCQGQQLEVTWRCLLKWSTAALLRTLPRHPVVCWINFSLLGLTFKALHNLTSLLCAKVIKSRKS